MDESGDGSITHRELIIGFMKVLGEDIAEEEAIKIFNKVDLDENGSLDFKDFLISSVDLADRDYIMTYMKNAYLQFFDNEFEEVDTQELIDLFCAEKEIENKFVKEIMEQIDSDNSNTISACEFFEAIVNNLQLQDAGIDVA